MMMGKVFVFQDKKKTKKKTLKEFGTQWWVHGKQMARRQTLTLQELQLKWKFKREKDFALGRVPSLPAHRV